MLAHRLRLWANNKSTLVQRLVFAGAFLIHMSRDKLLINSAPCREEDELAGSHER